MNRTDVAAVHHLDAVEAAAYRDMLAAVPRSLFSLKAETREIAGATLMVVPGLPVPMFNRVIGLGNAQAAQGNDIDRIVGVYRDAGVKSWWIHLSPGAQPGTLANTLSARGFTVPPRKNWVKVVRGVEAPAAIETALEIREVRADEAQALGETLCAAFEMPSTLMPWFAALVGRENWRAVGAFDQGRLVGGGLLHLQGHSAWMGAGGVRPEARRHHAHRALMALRIQLAIAAGCTLITTETGEPVGDEPNPSLRNMFASGFELVFARANYAAPAVAP
jgi:hypothetical protein